MELREPLNKVAQLPADVLNDCNSSQGVATKRLSWHLIDAKIPQNGSAPIKNGAVNINDACLREHSNISRALRLVERASLSPMGDIKRQ